MKTENDKKTKLQQKFEDQTPTIKNVRNVEYLQTYCTWLELQVEKANGDEYRQLLEQFIEQMEVFNETGFDDGLQELEEEVTRVLQE